MIIDQLSCGAPLAKEKAWAAARGALPAGFLDTRTACAYRRSSVNEACLGSGEGDLSYMHNQLPSNARHILVVEDDPDIADSIVASLEERSHSVVLASSYEDACTQLEDHHFALIVLDRMLGNADGLAIIEMLRGRGDTVPILVLSALNAVIDRIEGLTAGGDDYLIKPFALGEMVARIDALLRRPAASGRETSLTAGPLVADLLARTVTRDGQLVDLLPREFRILEYMMRRPNQVLTRDMLLRDVWNYRFIPKTNLVDVHVGRLRRKLDENQTVQLFHVVRGVGFVLKVDV